MSVDGSTHDKPNPFRRRLEKFAKTATAEELAEIKSFFKTLPAGTVNGDARRNGVHKPDSARRRHRAKADARTPSEVWEALARNEGGSRERPVLEPMAEAAPLLGPVPSGTALSQLPARQTSSLGGNRAMSKLPERDDEGVLIFETEEAFFAEDSARRRDLAENDPLFLRMSEQHLAIMEHLKTVDEGRHGGPLGPYWQAVSGVARELDRLSSAYNHAMYTGRQLPKLPDDPAFYDLEQVLERIGPKPDLSA